MKSYFEVQFSDCLAKGLLLLAASETVAHSFLDGKPQRSGKAKVTNADRHAAFWSASFVCELPREAWTQEAMVLALARYMGQDSYENSALVKHVAAIAPDAVQRAARCSGLVLRHASQRWKEIAALAKSHPASFEEFAKIFEIFEEAHTLRISDVEECQRALSKLTPLELLVYASLFAFEYIVPQSLGLASNSHDIGAQEAWDAINDILCWKLSTCDPSELHLTDRDIGLSLKEHLSPFLFPTQDGPPTSESTYQSFHRLMAAHMELNSFVSQSAEAFSYDDGIRFVRRGDRLEIEELKPDHSAKRDSESQKLERLHLYWLYRGMDALMESPALLALVGPEHLEANLQAFAKAMGTWLQLQEVYGIADKVKTETGMTADVFLALLAMEMMTVFFIHDFLQPFANSFEQCRSGHQSLAMLALSGMRQQDMQNRFPITWSDKVVKINRIKAWTVSAQFPQGNAKAAEAILDFWTSDWTILASQLRHGQSGLVPELFERPMLKMGTRLFQLPWMVAMQNNATAAINNLRRLGSRRMEAREEALRIEQRLGAQFEKRGFRVLPNYQPKIFDAEDAGEIDLLCALDGHLLVLEVKSTFLRRSKKEAWIHRTSTLRKAGLQLERKVRAALTALESDPEVASALGIPSTTKPQVTGWIVDTSIECDHQNFSGFLKVSVEEVLIALRDDRRLPNDPHSLFREGLSEENDAISSAGVQSWTLYPQGFSASGFIEAIETESVWSATRKS